MTLLIIWCFNAPKALEINNHDVTSVNDLYRYLSKWPLGKPVTLNLLRGKERIDIIDVLLVEAGSSI